MPVFFPFGIPTTSSFATSAQTAITVDAPPGYTAPFAVKAIRGPAGSPGVNAVNCPPGYENALNPSNPSEFPPVPSQAIDRSGYLLCFPTSNLSPTPSATITPSPTITPSATITPTPTMTPSPAAVCNNLGSFVTANTSPSNPSNCAGLSNEYTNGSVTLYSTNCSNLSSPVGCTIYTVGCSTTAYDAGVVAFRTSDTSTYYILNSSSQIVSSGDCVT